MNIYKTHSNKTLVFTFNIRYSKLLEIGYTGGQGPFVNGLSKEEQDKRVLQLGARGERESKGSGLAIAIPATQAYGSWGQVTHKA